LKSPIVIFSPAIFTDTSLNLTPPSTPSPGIGILPSPTWFSTGDMPDCGLDPMEEGAAFAVGLKDRGGAFPDGGAAGGT